MPQYPVSITAAAAASFYGIEIGLAPVVTDATAAILDNATVNAAAGTPTATNTPTSWYIESGNEAGYFKINKTTGAVTVAVADPPAGTYTLVVVARNATGADHGTDTITVTAH
jgi:hypothetical protein